MTAPRRGATNHQERAPEGAWAHHHGRRDPARCQTPGLELTTNAVVETAQRNLVGYGQLGPLVADDVWEIMVDAPDGAFIGS